MNTLKQQFRQQIKKNHCSKCDKRVKYNSLVFIHENKKTISLCPRCYNNYRIEKYK